MSELEEVWTDIANTKGPKGDPGPVNVGVQSVSAAGDKLRFGFTDGRPAQDVALPLATSNSAGLLSPEDKAKIDMASSVSVSVSGPEVVLWGDSMTSRWTGYAGLLESVTGATVHDGGVGGETSTAIAARQGARPFRLKPQGGSIPGSGPVDVTITAPPNAWPLIQSGSTGPMVGALAGVRGTLTLDKAGNQYSHDPADRYIFTRQDSGQAVRVTGSPVFTPSFGDARRGDVAVIWAGRNNTSNPDLVASDVRRMVNHLAPVETRFLVVSVLTGGTETADTAAHTRISEINALLADEWGERFLDLRSYLVEQAIHDAGIAPTPADLAQIDGDTVPASLRVDNIHLNETGNSLVANWIGSALYEAGWVPRLNPIQLGVPAPAHSFVAEDSTLRDTVTGATMAVPATFTAHDEGFPFVRLPSGAAGRATATIASGATFTVSLIVRTARLADMFLRLDGLAMGRNSDGSWRFHGNGNIYSGPPRAGWTNVVGVFDPARSAFYVTDTRMTGTLSRATTALGQLMLGHEGGTTGDEDFAEAVIWDQALTDAEVQRHRAAMRAKYSALEA